jgi:single-strand DNA-binding protein
MADFNQVIIIGRIASELNLHYAPTGTPICNFNFATGKDEDVVFIECSAFNKTAELLCQYSGKGQSLCVVGRLKQDKWEKEGHKFSKIKVLVDKIQFLSYMSDKNKPENEDF